MVVVLEVHLIMGESLEMEAMIIPDVEIIMEVTVTEMVMAMVMEVVMVVSLEMIMEMPTLVAIIELRSTGDVVIRHS